MFLVELVMQGVRGFQKVARLRFQGGFNIVLAGNESGKTTAADTLTRLLFPVNDPARMDRLISRATPDASRGAMVVFADDQAYYQVIQDFSKRAVNLSRHDPASKKFVLQYKDWNSTSQFLGTMLPQVAEEDYGRIFLFRRESCTGSPAHGASAANAPARPAAARAAMSAADTARVAELKVTLQKAEEAADAEYKADAARIRLNEIVQKLDRLEEGRTQRADLEQQIADLKICETFPENLAEMISTHEDEQSQKMVRTDELDQDIEGLTLQRDSIPAPNILVDKLFIAGAALTVLSIIAGLFILSDEQAMYFPLGVMGGVLLIVAAWYNQSRKNVQRRTIEKDIDGLVKERADVEKKFQDSGATIMKFMKAAGVATAGELKEKADNYRHFLSLLEDIEHQERLALGGQTEEVVRAELAVQQEEVAKREDAARSLAKYAVDTYSVRQEIERIESEASPGGMDLGFGGHDFGGGFDAPAPAAASGAGFNMLADVAIASRMSGIEMETLVPAVESAAQRNLSSASAGRYVRVEIGPDGLPVVHDLNGAKHSFGGLSHSTGELVCFCLRAGLVESIAGKRRLPFVLDDPFAGLDPARQAAACQVLRVLGAKTQVILFTSNPALRAPNDTAQELK